MRREEWNLDHFLWSMHGGSKIIPISWNIRRFSTLTNIFEWKQNTVMFHLNSTNCLRNCRNCNSLTDKLGWKLCYSISVHFNKSWVLKVNSSTFCLSTPGLKTKKVRILIHGVCKVNNRILFPFENEWMWDIFTTLPAEQYASSINAGAGGSVHYPKCIVHATCLMMCNDSVLLLSNHLHSITSKL